MRHRTNLLGLSALHELVLYKIVCDWRFILPWAAAAGPAVTLWAVRGQRGDAAPVTPSARLVWHLTPTNNSAAQTARLRTESSLNNSI